MRVFTIYLATCSLFYTCLALPEVHKQMTTDQLQSVFHVEDHSSVPDYELVQLTHHGVLHTVRKRSISNLNEVSAKESHHVKKDLSKSPYYSELKLALKQHDANSLSDQNFSEKLKNLDLAQIREHNVSFSAFGEVLNLTLKPAEGLFKDGPKSLRMWTVRSDANATQGVQYDEVYDEMGNPDEHIGEVFQDEKNMAAILLRRQMETGDLVMEGSIGHELVIKPLPKNLSPKDDVHHVIYKREADSSDQFSDFAFMEPDRLEKRYRERRSATAHDDRNDDADAVDSDNDDKGTKASTKRSKREAPYIIYPEILVIVDYDGYRLHGGDNLQVKRYFVSFWNGVDLRYRLLKGPRIRISIAGIIISRGRDATPYLERNRVGRDAIDSAAALTDMGKYLFRERRLPVYDIAVAITKLDMCRRLQAYGECKRGTAGFAYVGGACVVNKRLEKVNSVAIIEDTGGFSGIIVAAHEVGHLLGAVHDGSPPPSYLGGPGAEKCRWEDGYIMSDLRHTERGFRWSPCTVQSFHHFLNGDTASCLHNAPHEDEALGRSLPGTLLSLDAQCRRDRGTYACFKDDRVCAQLFCFDSLTGYCVAYRPAAEGSSCGNGLHCLDGRCVAQQQQQNSIPNYTQDGGFSNPYRPVFNDEYDDIEDTTIIVPSSTAAPFKYKKRLYYRSTTQQAPSSGSSDRSFDDYLNSFPMATDNPSDSLKSDKSLDSTKPRYTTSTSATTATTTSTRTTTKRATSINPFYFGFSKFTTTSTAKPPTIQTPNINNRLYQSFATTAKPPSSSFSYLNNKNNQYNSNNNEQINTRTIVSSSHDLPKTKMTSTTTLRPKTLTTTTTTSNYYTIQINNSNGKRNEKLATTSEQQAFFNSYLKKLKSTTRSPYNFDNFAQYYKTTSTKPLPLYSSSDSRRK